MIATLCHRLLCEITGARCGLLADHEGPCIGEAAIAEALRDWGRVQALCDDEPAVGPLFEGRE